jgi:hypothetical protein
LCASLNVSIDDLDHWEPVLDATSALQIPSVQQYIIQGIRDDKQKISRDTPRLLRLAIRIQREDLEWDCIFDLAYRAHPISPSECFALGLRTVVMVMTVRERARNHLKYELSRYSLSQNCSKDCRSAIVQAIQRQLQTPSPERMLGSVLDIPPNSGLCLACANSRTLLDTYRTEILDNKVRAWAADYQRAEQEADLAA